MVSLQLNMFDQHKSYSSLSSLFCGLYRESIFNCMLTTSMFWKSYDFIGNFGNMMMQTTMRNFERLLLRKFGEKGWKKWKIKKVKWFMPIAKKDMQFHFHAKKNLFAFMLLLTSWPTNWIIWKRKSQNLWNSIMNLIFMYINYFLCIAKNDPQ